MAEQHEKEISFKEYFVPLTTGKAIHFLVIIGTLVFCNGLFNNFVGDDPPLITGNPVIQSLTNLPAFFTGSIFYSGPGYRLEGFSYRPLQTTTFAIIYAVFGANYFWFHFFQILLYIINSCLVFILFRNYFNRVLSFFLALFFLVHPINSEVAFYISDTQDVLFFFFGLLSLVILHKSQTTKSLLVASSSLFLSLLSKEAGALFLFMAGILLLLKNRKQFFLWIGYLVCVLFLYGTLRIVALGFGADTTVLAPIHDLSFASRLINIPAIISFYLEKVVFPYELSMSYHWVVKAITMQTFFIPLVVDTLFFFIIILGAVFFYRNEDKKYVMPYLFFLSWFIVGMVLYLQIIPLDLTVSERWFYFPFVGLLGMCGVVISFSKVSFKQTWFIVFCILLLLSVRTFIRSFDWRNEFTIATHDLHVAPDSYNLELKLGGAYLNEQDFVHAKLHVQRSIALYPNAVNYSILGLIDYKLHNYKEAKEAYLHAQQFGEYEETYTNLAMIALFYGDPQENITYLKNVALKKYPNNTSVLMSLAWLEYKYGDKTEAKSMIRKAYDTDQQAQIGVIYNAIINNKPLNLAP